MPDGDEHLWIKVAFSAIGGAWAILGWFLRVVYSDRRQKERDLDAQIAFMRAKADEDREAATDVAARLDTAAKEIERLREREDDRAKLLEEDRLRDEGSGPKRRPTRR